MAEPQADAVPLKTAGILVLDPTRLVAFAVRSRGRMGLDDRARLEDALRSIPAPDDGAGRLVADWLARRPN